ncbi:MAG: dihydrolipoyl dehydrogenase [Verrucomicrobia bacterium]|nr:dihydrolipoyl dehydrogenase [Verrucomicrobiota bacterium]
MHYDLLVIGGGPAGYVGAIRAAQLGKKVGCIEMDRAGGTCLNWGCIPTKSLLRNAELFHLLKHKGGDYGFKFDNLAFDWSKIIGRSRDVSNKLAGGIEFLFKKNKVDYLRGEATFKDGKTVTVKDKDGKTAEHTADKYLIATGTVARALPDLPFDGEKVLNARQAMVLAKQPEHIVILGAGAIGVEFAYFFNAFGTKVTLIEMMPRILPVEDDEISAALERSFKKAKINVLTGVKSNGVKKTAKGVEVALAGADGKPGETLVADCALIAIGVSPVVPGGLKLELERGYIKTDARYQTSVPNVYAAGDIIGPPWLAHVASWEAIQAVEGIFAGHTPKKVEIFPGCTYCQPQVASVGQTERALKEKGIKYKVGKFPFSASGKALATGESEGFAKLIYGAEHGELLGAHIIGNEATELIAEMGLALTMEATHEEIEATIHAHPTLSEAIHEATGVAFGHPVHV